MANFLERKRAKISDPLDKNYREKYDIEEGFRNPDHLCDIIDGRPLNMGKLDEIYRVRDPSSNLPNSEARDCH